MPEGSQRKTAANRTNERSIKGMKSAQVRCREATVLGQICMGGGAEKLPTLFIFEIADPFRAGRSEHAAVPFDWGSADDAGGCLR